MRMIIMVVMVMVMVVAVMMIIKAWEVMGGGGWVPDLPFRKR